MAEQKNVQKCVVQRKKGSSKVQEVVRKKQSKQLNTKRHVVKTTAKGELKMNKTTWMKTVAKFTAALAVQATFVAALNAGISVAP